MIITIVITFILNDVLRGNQSFAKTLNTFIYVWWWWNFPNNGNECFHAIYKEIQLNNERYQGNGTLKFDIRILEFYINRDTWNSAMNTICMRFYFYA